MNIKEEDSRRIINIARKVKTPTWPIQELRQVLKTLKNDKCHDPNGLINAIFK